MKTYLKTLLPWRWIFPIIFIILMSAIITLGFVYEDPINPLYFKNKILWYGGNFLFWFIFDFFFGLGQVNYWERKEKLKNES